MTAADVEAAFGKSSSGGKIDEHGNCAFEVSGTIHAGPNKSVPGTVGVSFRRDATPMRTGTAEQVELVHPGISPRLVGDTAPTRG